MKVEGTIEQVYDNGPKKGRFGTQHRITIVVDGERYSGFFSKSAEALGLEEGKTASFTATQNGEYWNVDTKSLKVSGPSKPSGKPSGKPQSYSGSGNAGIKVGHALNNAVNLAIADGDLTVDNIHRHAVRILALSVKLESQFDNIIEMAPKVLQACKEEEKGSEESPESEPEAPPPSKAKSKKAPAKSKAKAVPPPEEDEEEGEDVGDEEPAWDDDIPFN